jgi:hypothetical protein
MKPAKLTLVIGALFAASALLAAVPTQQNGRSGESPGSLADGMTINAQLKSSVDSKKVKPGDAVTAETTETVKSSDGRTILPRGTKLIGQVTQASSRAKGDSESMLGIQFEKAVTKSGEEVPLNNVVIEAVAPPSSTASDFAPGPSATGPAAPPSNPSMSGSAGARAGSNTTGSNPANPYPGAAGQTETRGGYESGPLPANSRGVYGLPGLSLGRANSSNGESSVIASNGKNVHLDSGTRLLLVTQAHGSRTTPGR